MCYTSPKVYDVIGWVACFADPHIQTAFHSSPTSAREGQVRSSFQNPRQLNTCLYLEESTDAVSKVGWTGSQILDGVITVAGVDLFVIVGTHDMTSSRIYVGLDMSVIVKW